MRQLSASKRCTTWELWVKFYLGQNDCIQEKAPQIGLRNCSEEVGRRELNMCDFGERGVHEIKHLPYKIFSASQKELMSPWSDLDARIGIMKSAPENIKLSKDLSHQFFWSTEYLILLPELPLGHIKDQQQKQHRLNPHRGRWQMPLANSILFLIQQQKKEKIICVKIFQTIQVSTF